MRNLKQSEIKETKREILEKQGRKCAICGCDLVLEKSVLDHQHKNKKTDENGVNGNGLVRGVLCNNCNLVEGKIWNNTKRFLQFQNTQERIDFLEKLIFYYKQEKYPLVHPTEVQKEPNVSKKNFNKLKKEYKLKYPKKKDLEYPKSQKLTKQLSKLFEEFQINPFN